MTASHWQQVEVRTCMEIKKLA